MTNRTRTLANRVADPPESKYGPQPGFGGSRRELRAARRGSKHTRRGPQHAMVGIARGFKKRFDLPLRPSVYAAIWHTTKRRHWDKKAERRADNQRARLSRKANRSN